jgi:hypothetical protein
MGYCTWEFKDLCKKKQNNGLGSRFNPMKEKTCELERLQTKADILTIEQEKLLREELNGLLEQEDIKWRQRSKENWLKNRDRNTKYFHACAN